MKGQILGYCQGRNTFHKFNSLAEMVRQNRHAMRTELTKRPAECYAPVCVAATNDAEELYVAQRRLLRQRAAKGRLKLRPAAGKGGRP